MEKLVFSYLNASHPNIFLKKVKFGKVVCKFSHEYATWMRHKEYVILPTIMKLFSIDWETAEDMVDAWVNSLHVIENTD